MENFRSADLAMDECTVELGVILVVWALWFLFLVATLTVLVLGDQAASLTPMQ